MSKASHSGDHQRDHEFDRIVHEYYRAVEAGGSPDREDWIARYPMFAEELDSFLSDINQVAGPPPVRHARVLGPAVIPPSKFEWDRDDTPETRSERTRANAMESAGHEVHVEDRLPRTTEFIRDYLLLKKLGEGGFGSVYLAVHTQLEKRVAIKVLKGDGGRDRKLVERFCREIKAVGKFEHDHIVRAFDAGKIDGLYFLVMEFIDGYDLADLLASAGPLSVADACELIRQAALGLQHAHEAGLVHRDVKPSNLMLTAEGQVKLLDLGLAQLRQRYHQSTALTADGQAMGTWKYMAPEQFVDSGRVEAACDIFSLGVTLYQLLRGGLPTTGPHAAVEYTDLKAYRGDVPDEVVELIGEMTHLDPTQRIGDAGEVIRRLDPWTEGHDLGKLFENTNRKRLSVANHPIPAPPPLARQVAALGDGAVATVPDQSYSPAESQTRWLAPTRDRLKLAGGGVAAIALSTLLLGLVQPWTWWGKKSNSNEATAPAPATLIIEVSKRVDPQRSQSFGGFLFNTENEKPHQLVVGINEVSHGNYRFDLGKWVIEKPESLQETIELEPGTSLTIEVAPRIVQPNGHVLYPTIPKRAGAWAEFRTNVMPVGQGEVPPQNYDIRLQALNREIVDSREFQWLEVSVDHPGHYRETAWILFDSELYEQEQELRVERGYVEIALHEERGGLLEPVKNTLTARWSDEVDPLDELADDLQIKWQENRVKPLSVLSVLFDYSHPAVDDAISQLRTEMGSLPIQPWSEVDGYTGVGYFPALEISASSDPRESEQGLEYTIIRVQKDEAVPFSFLDVRLHSSRLDVTFHLSKMGSESRRDSVDLVSLEHAVARVEEFASPPPDDYDFTRATLPEVDGEFCRYLADIEFGGDDTRKLVAVAEIRAGKRVAVDGGFGRWIELVVEKPTWEAAKLLIDEEAYNGGREFQVLRGYHWIDGQVFDYRVGDTKITEQQLARLKHPRKFSPSPFGVREVLALLFDAPLPPGDPLAALRTQIEASIAKESTERKPRVVEIAEKGRKQRKYLGHEWTLDKIDNPDFVYDVAHSRAIHFGFGSVKLSLPGFKIETYLIEAGSKPDLLGSEEVLIQGAAQTRDQLNDKNLHVWTIGGEPELWRLDRYRLDKLDLRDPDPESTRRLELEWIDLTSEDQQWVMETQGRQWRWKDSNGREHEETALLQSFDGYEKIRLRCEDNEIITVETDLLSLQDQEFVESERKLR